VMYDRDGHDWGWGTWLGMGLMMTVLTVLVVAVVVLVVRTTTGPQRTATSLPPGNPRDTPRDSEALRVLDERFAGGDIDEGEYVARRDLLCGRP
jgi:putative membrane protein